MSRGDRYVQKSRDKMETFLDKLISNIKTTGLSINKSRWSNDFRCSMGG